MTTCTPPGNWWSTPERTGSEHLAAVLTRHRYEVLETSDDLTWVVPSHERLVHRYALHGVLARKGA